MSDLKDVPITEEAANTMLGECARLEDSSLARSVEQVVRGQDAAISDITYSLLVRAFAAREPEHARSIVDEAVALRGKQCSPDLVSTVLAFCAKEHDSSLPDYMFERLKPHSAGVVAAFIRFFLETGNSRFSLGAEPFDAALSCGRSSLARKLLAASPSDIAKHITMIQGCAAEKNLQGAFDIFASLERSGVDMNSVVYNSVLEACVQCRDFAAAEDWMKKSKEAGMAE
eukprot:CAMPEP_0169413388 /NCGR_PEP_ID=MMETSP1017-20121227/61326_1 /TAXON_ID=342587 /ORGANISM="Karlodinium micrum, Strain CCMP2283" /LENGTH=228 /DNA_ID=CAMNT_0009520793 /DNA_START=62 /DNA_END=746 /DNA_ORIENTATION=-